MANGLYNKAREEFLNGAISWGNDNIKAMLYDVGAGGAINLAAADPTYASVTAGLVGSVSPNFTGKTVTDGVADADNVTCSAVSGATVEVVIIYKDTGVPSTSRLIAAIDTATGLVLTPNSGDVLISWADTSNKIFKL